MIFSAFLDSTESDYFYLIEPMLEFVRTINFDPDLLKDILEIEFPIVTI